MKNINSLLPPSNFPRPDAVIKTVCDLFKITRKDLMSRTRVQPIAFARQLAIAMVYHHCHTSLKETGRIFSRHHSSVVHARKVVSAMARDKRISKVINQLMETIKEL